MVDLSMVRWGYKCYEWGDRVSSRSVAPRSSNGMAMATPRDCEINEHQYHLPTHINPAKCAGVGRLFSMNVPPKSSKTWVCNLLVGIHTYLLRICLAANKNTSTSRRPGPFWTLQISEDFPRSLKKFID